MARPLHFVLVGLVALLVGFADSGKAWGQGPPVATGAPCRTNLSGFVNTTGKLGVSASWTVTVTPGVGSIPEVGGDQNHTARGQLTSIIVFVGAILDDVVLLEPVTLTDTWDFGLEKVTAPNALEKSARDRMNRHQLIAAISRMENSKSRDVQLVAGAVAFAISGRVEHWEGPIVNPPENSPLPWFLLTPPTLLEVVYSTDAAYSTPFDVTTPTQ